MSRRHAAVSPEIPRSWDDVSATWMTAALAKRFPDATVGGVELLLRDDGTNRRARFALSYVDGSGPATVFLKAADPEHALINAKTGGVFNEAWLFQRGAVLPVDHPDVFLSLVDEERLDFLLVMEDVVGRGGDPRDATRPLTLAQAASGVRALARLHGAYWGNRFADAAELSWVEPLVAWRGMARGIDIGLERAGDRIPDVVRSMSGAEINDGQWCRFVDTVSDGPTTLLHGDAHIGNTYVLADDDLGFLDWQVVRRGNFSLDLGYFLQGALTVEDRRAGERDLLDDYRRALDVDDPPTGEEIWLRYRASAAHGLALWLATAASTWQRPEISLTLSERHANAFVDLDTPSALDDLVGRSG